MLTGNNRVVEQLHVASHVGVLIVELHHFQVVSEHVQGHLLSLGDCDEFIFSLRLESGQRLQNLFQLFVFFQQIESESTCLFVEEGGGVENCLLIFASQLIKEEGLIGVGFHLQLQMRMLQILHVLQVTLRSLSGAHQSLQRVAHQEHGEVLLQLVNLFLLVKQSLNESSLISIVSHSHVAISGNIHSVKLVHKFKSLFSRQSVVDGNNSNTSLLKVLNVSSWHIADSLVFSIGDELVLNEMLVAWLVKVTSDWLGENTNHGSACVVQRCISQLLLVVVLGRSVLWQVLPVLLKHGSSSVAALKKKRLLGSDFSSEEERSIDGGKASNGASS